MFLRLQLWYFSIPFSYRVVAFAALVLLFIGFHGCTDNKKTGEEYFLLGEYEKAIKAYDKVLGLDPYDHYSFYNRGRAKQELGLHHEAILDFDMAVKWDYQNSDYYLSRGKSYFALEDYKSSEVDFKNAVQRNPKSYWANLMLGRSYWKLERNKDAWHYIELANEIDDSDTGGRYFRGLVRASLGNAYGAIDDFTYYLKNEPENATILYNRAICYKSLGFYNWALADLDKALKLEPKYDEAIIQKLIISFFKGERNTACTELAKYAQTGNINALEFASHYCR